MTKPEAYELGKKYLQSHDTVVVLSDGAVYLNNDVDFMKAHAIETLKEAFVIKGEVKEPVKEVIKEVEAVEEIATSIEKKQSKKNK